MKITFFTLIAILLTSLSFSQSEEGQIIYSIEMSSDEPQMEMAIQMMSGSTFELTFNHAGSMAKMDMGAIMSMTTVRNGDDVLILMGGMMGKKAVKTTQKELASSEKFDKEASIEITEETKVIAGYKCQKAIITNSEDNVVEYWFTSDFKLSAGLHANANSLIPGIALEFSIDKKGMTMTYTATSISKEVSDDVTFETSIPEGYDIMTMEEIQSIGL